jgi:hypothetical protein
MLRNETNQPAETIAVQFLPEGATRRIDEPEPPQLSRLSDVSGAAWIRSTPRRRGGFRRRRTRSTDPQTDPMGVSVDNGAFYTNDAHVKLNIVAPPGATQIVVSNDGGFTGLKTTTHRLAILAPSPLASGWA